MRNNLDHHKGVDFGFLFDHFIGSLDFNIDFHSHMQSSVGLQVEVDRPTGEPQVGLRLSQGFYLRAVQRPAPCVCVRCQQRGKLRLVEFWSFLRLDCHVLREPECDEQWCSSPELVLFRAQECMGTRL
jgi:hypothetical protein